MTVSLGDKAADPQQIIAELRRNFDEVTAQQVATAEILKVIASSRSDVQPVFEAIVDSAARLFEPCGATITTLKDGQLHWNATAATLQDFDIERAKAVYPIPFDPERAPSARALLERRTIEIPDIAAPDTPELTRKAAAAGGFRSIVFVPLIKQDKGIGTIILTHLRAGFKLSEKQLALVRTFADQAVIAIENARLFNETQEALERQTATAEILKVIASSPSDVQPVFDAIATSSKWLVGAFSAVVFRFVDGVAHVVAFTPTSPAADQLLKASFPRPVAEFPPFERAHAGGVVQVPDTEAEPDERMKQLARARGFRSVLNAPLMSKETPLGMITVTRKDPGPFADHHVQLLQTFADQAVIAIENARLFDEVHAKTRDLSEALTYQTGSGNILRVIASSPTDVKPVLKAIVESACDLCEANDAIVALRNGDDLLFLEQHGSIPVVWERRPINRRWTPGRAVVDRKPVHVHDLSAEGEEFPEGREIARRDHVRTVLSVPLLRGNESIGAILLRRTEVQPFSEKQIALLQTFADQAVIAIGNVRLFEQVQQRTKELSRSLDDLRTAQDRLIQTEKLASLGQLTAGIAHEIKNPLNFVNNFSALSAELVDELNDTLKPAALDNKMRREVDDLTQMLKGNLEKVVQHGKRADSIVKNMLLHSREGSGEHRPADINALLDESLNLAYHGARAEKSEFNITLQRDFDDNAGMIELFPQEITRAFLNLISNGFYAATKRKAEIGNSGFEPALSATTRNKGNSVEIRIRDNGTGIPTEVKEKMFNPFFTTKPAGEGTGLGLSMSHDIIVKQHGGKIDVDTKPGIFTEFIITLPRTIILQKTAGGPN
jgi:two-component system, NtrC family, sensor kinase